MTRALKTYGFRFGKSSVTLAQVAVALHPAGRNRRELHSLEAHVDRLLEQLHPGPEHCALRHTDEMRVPCGPPTQGTGSRHRSRGRRASRHGMRQRDIGKRRCR